MSLKILVHDLGYGRRVANNLTEFIHFDGMQSFGQMGEVAQLPAGTSVTFIVPVLGEDELVEPYAAYFDVLGRSPGAADKVINVVLAGDVHPSDPETVVHTVIARQIASRLQFLANGAIFPQKLADWNANASVDALSAFLFSRTILSADDIAIARLSSMLQAPPAWTPAEGILELVNAASGESLLSHYSAKGEIVAALSSLPIRRLCVARSGLRDADLRRRLASESLTHLDISSNLFESLDFLREQMPYLIWLSIAANALETVNFSVFPNGLKHLYLHKNRLTALRCADRCPAGLKTLSLYRNRLTLLPDLGHLKDLTSLNLGANPITELPPWVERLNKLTQLGLAQTEIECLPDWIFTTPSIKEIDLCGLEGRLGAKVYAELREQGVRVLSRNISHAGVSV
jgi:hypothetical protein